MRSVVAGTKIDWAQGERPKWWAKGMRYLGNERVEWRFSINGIPRTVHGKTERQLKSGRARIEAEAEAVPDEDRRLDDVLEAYLKEREADGYDDRQTNELIGKFKKYVQPLGQYWLSELCTQFPITAEHFKQMRRKYPNSRALQMAFDELRRAYRFAIEKGWCKVNPCLNVMRQRPQYAAPEKEPFTTDQVWAMLDKADLLQTAVIVFFYAATALRPGEIYGLRVRDLDLLHHLGYIRTFVGRDKKGREFEKEIGKNEAAIREIDLIPKLVVLLERYLAVARLGPNDYLFPGERKGLRLNANNWRERVFKPLAALVGKPGATPYSLRHTTNTLLYEEGVDETMRAAICGHSVATNKRVYTHAMREARRKAMAKLDARFPANMGQNVGQAAK